MSLVRVEERSHWHFQSEFIFLSSLSSRHFPVRSFPLLLFTEFWFFSVPYLARLYLDWDTPFQGEH